jgi:predicted SprT family Zn-dependent metalloprotease
MDLDAAAALALQLMKEHRLNGWEFAFDNAKTRAGVCRPERRQIGLSRPLTRLHTEAEVRDTILHEIAHALVGAEHGHDEDWVRKAREVGCSGQRCVSSSAGRLQGDWVGTCSVGHTVTRHRRPERVLSCQRCSPRFSAAAIFDWTYRGHRAPLHPAYLVELAQVRALLLDATDLPGDGAEPAPRAVRAVLPVGTRVVIDGDGPFSGQSGRVSKRGRTRYEVLTAQGVVSVLAISVRPQ